MSRQTKQLMKENNDLALQLHEGDNRILTDIVVYIRGADISAYQQELVRRDITQMILDGEQRGDTAEDIIGGDYKTFCDNVLKEVPRLTSAEKSISFLGTICAASAVLLTVWLLFALTDTLKENNTWPDIPITTGNIISTFLILCAAILIYNFITKNSFNSRFLRSKKIPALCILILVICICTDLFLNTVILTIHAVPLLLTIVALYILYKITDIIN